MSVPPRKIVANNGDDAKNTREDVNSESVENEQPQYDESSLEALWGGQAASEPTSLPSAKVLASAPWIIPEHGSADVVGLVLSGPIIVETVYDPATRTARFAVKEPGKEPCYAESLKDKGGRVFRPLVDSMVHNGVVLLPSEIGPATDPPKLLGEVVGFLHRYVNFAHLEDLVVAATYILFTWRFDEFTKVPYLRVHGPPGSGKWRALKTIASIGYRAINVPGGSSGKAMLRLLNKFRGTAIVYFADITGRSQRDREAAIQLALGSLVDLLDIALKPERWADSWEPMARSLFGPKVLATSESPLHPLLDSICLTLELEPTERTDIPISLPPFQRWHEADELRNKLLRYRLDYAQGYPDHESPRFEKGFSPHLQELVMPLRKVAEDSPEALPFIDTFIGRRDLPQLASTRLSGELIVLNAIAMRLGRGEPIPIKSLAEELTEEGTEEMTPTLLGIMLSNLGVSTRRSTGGLTVVNTNLEELIDAYRSIGEEPPPLVLALADSYEGRGELPQPHIVKDQHSSGRGADSWGEE